VIAVPDCTESIRLGDISIACHQHLSYFTRSSLRACLRAAGLIELRGHTVSAEGTLYVAAYAGERPLNRLEAQETFGRFYARAAANRTRIGAIIHELQFTARLGVYVPMRLFPYCPVFDPGVRLFDDGMRGQFLDGVTEVIEGLEDFNAEPDVDVMLVMSLTHDKAIVDKLAGRCKVITLREMLDA
jgi:hypothetical protein